ncbi:hypothetical protein BZA77DRAFT_292341 [Pyronema omphalodes]|nr:hypothetical protein BZA77DRAFT_292341 [Pyronema omphalodes]
MAPRNRSPYCGREKRTCYGTLGFLFILSVILFGISFAPAVRGTTGRVYLWALSCSVFTITSCIVLFLASFCNRCRSRKNDLIEDGFKRSSVDSNEKDVSPSSTMTSDDLVKHKVSAQDLKRYQVGPIPPRTSQESENRTVLSNIEEESTVGDESNCSPPTPPAVSMVRRQSISEPELSSPYAGDVYTVPTKPSTNPFDSNLPQTQEEMWRFEKDWTTWNGSGIAPGRRIGSMNSQRRDASFITVGDDEELKASGKSMPNLLTSQQ